MRGGISNSAGIVFYDTDKKENNAVFCFFKDGEPSFITGEKSEIIAKSKNADIELSVIDKKSEDKILLWAALLLIGFVAAVWIFFGGFFNVFGAFLFVVISYFPILVLAFSINRIYPEDESFHQFRKFHGAEHMLIEYSRKKNPTWEIDDIRKISFYHKECGTVYSGEAVFFAAVFGISFALIPQIGLLRFFGTVILTFILLFLNLFNPYNPFMFFQRFAVEKPGDEEILLATKGIKILDGIE